MKYLTLLMNYNNQDIWLHGWERERQNKNHSLGQMLKVENLDHNNDVYHVDAMWGWIIHANSSH